ncbi:hypothetical protein CCR75_007610 [Bremia lactucae]|uniref:Uncharacterized protein n=1 Tax=Bremia lactucae TaxID=4779 RepID=A0A976ILS5_BRELC|nr:hypothetical protein CCR75_007610 [Bremia lactucae]
MTQLVTELPEELTEIKATAEAASVKTRVPFEPRHLLNVGVRKASLYGREVDKWMGETDMEATSGSSDAASQETTDKALAAKHDRVLNALKQEEWKHRNARRQDLWDESLDMGKVKKVAKRKAFVPNEGRANMFQMTLMRKTKDAKRQRFG